MWAKNLSRPKLIYSATSPHSRKIDVWQRGRERTLVINDYPQSVNMVAEDLENRYWARIVDESAKKLSDPEAVLIFGLGGGTITHLLAQRFPGITIDGVEIDPVIVEVGRRFFELDKISNLQVIVADAADVCCNPELYELSVPQYSLIVFDVYLGDKAPPKVWEEETLRGISKLLAPKGIAVFNFVVHSNLGELRAKLDKIFNSVEEVGVRYGFGLPAGNVLYFCSRTGVGKERS